MFEKGDRVKVVKRTEYLPTNFLGLEGVVVKPVLNADSMFFVELSNGKISSFYSRELEGLNEQIARCPVCSDPLGVNEDMEIQPCANCNENNY